MYSPGMEQQIGFCRTSDGVRIAYKIWGSGPPVVYVPGWITHVEWPISSLTDRRMEAFGREFTAVQYDKRGTGLSDRGLSDYSLESRVRDLEAVVEHLKLRTFALWGISEGGPISIAYAAKHPRRVTALVLGGTYALGSRLMGGMKDQIIGLIRANWGFASETLENLFMPGAAEEQREAFRAGQQLGATAEDAIAILVTATQVDVRDRLALIKAPTLVYHVRGDRVVPYEEGLGIAAGIARARLITFEGNRHVPDPDTIVQRADEHIIPFLRECAPGRATTRPARRTSRIPQGEAPLTVLFTDIVGSTPLTQAMGDRRAQELVRAHNTVVRAALKEHRGREVKHTGDGVMASFPSAAQAIEAACAIQRGIAQQRVEGDGARHVRIGLNAGEPVAEDDDLFGTVVQLASRLCGQAGADEIVVSDVVRQLVAGKDFLFEDRGQAALKGFDDPVRLFAVRWAG